MPVSDDERQEILRLLAAGKVSVDEALELLAATGQSELTVDKQGVKESVSKAGSDPAAGLDNFVKIEQDPASEFAAKDPAARPTWLHVRVSDARTGKSKVTVNVPMRLVRYGLAIGRRFTPDLEELDWDEISGFIGSEKGMLVEVQDEEDGEHVQIFVD